MQEGRKGFTLVELSIVLVIIGLLIGGILVAQSMISASKLQAQVRQLQQYDIAVTNFQTKYNQLQGDSTLFTNPGNNNGFIDTWPTYECYQVWQHLSEGVGYTDATGLDYQHPLFTLADPSLKSNGSVSVILGWNDLAGIGGQGVSYYYWEAGTWNAFKPVDSLALDNKIDNGISTTGKVIAIGGSCLSGNSYDITNKDYVCALFIEMGISSGFTSH